MSNASDSLKTIFDHERVACNQLEHDRITETFAIYAGQYPELAYINSYGEVKERPYMTINMLNEVAKYLGSILYNEKCKISLSEEKMDAEFINKVLADNKFNRNFSQYIQAMLATGGLIVKPYFDPDSNSIKLSWILADMFIPLWDNSDTIDEAVVVSYTNRSDDKTKYYYTLMEFHEWAGSQYVITNELYRSEQENIVGRKVPLEEVYEGLEEYTVYDRFTRPNFVYLKPYGFNNIAPQSPLGLGVCDNAKTTLEQINNAYDQFYWELRQGARKVIVSDHFMQTRIDGNGKPVHYFDGETDVFVALPAGIDNMQFKDITHDIRSGQYIESINQFISALETQVGLSVGTFSFDGRSVRTATEIVAENSITYRTRNSHLTNVEEFIQELIIAICELARETIGVHGVPLYTGNIPEREDIKVDFDDGVFTDKMAELNFWSLATQAGLASKIEGMKRLHNLTEEDALKWEQQIAKEELLADPYEQQRQAESTLLGDFKD